MKRIILMTVLGLAAAPAFASDQPVALDDAALEKVSGGGDSVPVANVTTNTNVSPIVVVQNAYAITYQNANTGNSAWGQKQGQANGHKKDKKKNCHGSNGSNGSNGSTTPTPTSTGAVAQWANTQAFNIATINYTVTQR
jgi:hypothetical protein